MKRLAFLSTLLVVLVGVFIVTAPSLVSIEVVRRSISYEIAGWGGSALTFDGAPAVAFRPYLTVTFPKARITSTQTGDELVSMDQLSAQIPLIPLIFQGRIEPSAFDFRKPVFHFAIDAAGNPNWTLPYGLDSSTRVRRLGVTDAEVHYRGPRGQVIDISRVDATLRWPDPAGPASIEGSAEWRGLTGKFAAAIGSLRDFFEQKQTALQFSLASRPISVAFDGQVQRTEGLSASGALSSETPSIRDFGSLMGWHLADHPAFGPAALRGQVSLARGIATMADARLSIDGNEGEGALSLDVFGDRPAVQATLAFDKLEISPSVELAVDAIQAARATPDDAIDFSQFDRADLDMRLSADSMLYGGRSIGRLAGSVALRAGRLDVALADMRLFDGRVSASLSLETGQPEAQARLRLQFDALPLKSAPLDRVPVLAAEGTASGVLDVGTNGDRWRALLANLSGTGTIALRNGALQGIKLGALRAGWADPTLPASANSGASAFTEVACSFRLTHGLVATDDLKLKGSNFEAMLAGTADLDHMAVDMTGSAAFPASLSRSATRVPFALRIQGGQIEIAPGPGSTESGPLPDPAPAATAP